MLGSSTLGSSDAQYKVGAVGIYGRRTKPSNPGIVDLEVAVLDVQTEPALNAIQVEIAESDRRRRAHPARPRLDARLAVRLVGSAMRLRRLIP